MISLQKIGWEEKMEYRVAACIENATYYMFIAKFEVICALILDLSIQIIPCPDMVRIFLGGGWFSRTCLYLGSWGSQRETENRSTAGEEPLRKYFGECFAKVDTEVNRGHQRSFFILEEFFRI